jgi:hypothetical protein
VLDLFGANEVVLQHLAQRPGGLAHCRRIRHFQYVVFGRAREYRNIGLHEVDDIRAAVIAIVDLKAIRELFIEGRWREVEDAILDAADRYVEDPWEWCDAALLATRAKKMVTDAEREARLNAAVSDLLSKKTGLVPRKSA